MGVPEGEDREKGQQNFGRNSDWKVPKFEEINGIQVEKVQWTPSKINPKRYISRHIIKLLKEKDKEWVLETKRKVTHHVQGISQRLLVNYSAEGSEMLYLMCWLEKQKQKPVNKHFCIW